MDEREHYNVLLVEDEHFLRQSIMRTINNIDDMYKVTAQATNGEEACEILKKEDINIVITDIQMPVMNGLELAKHINSQYPDILTIILTGYADFDFAKEALKQHAFDYLLKPVDPDVLRTTLNNAGIKLNKFSYLNSDNDFSGHDAKEHVEFVVNYLQENYMNPIDIGELSEQMGFTSAYLSKIFKKYTDTTPIKMLTNIRIHKAKQLLSTTNLPISEIGAQVGYPDQFHFSKTFRKVVEMNPSTYRDAHQ